MRPIDRALKALSSDSPLSFVSTQKSFTQNFQTLEKELSRFRATYKVDPEEIILGEAFSKSLGEPTHCQGIPIIVTTPGYVSFTFPQEVSHG